MRMKEVTLPSSGFDNGWLVREVRWQKKHWNSDVLWLEVSGVLRLICSPFVVFFKWAAKNQPNQLIYSKIYRFSKNFLRFN